MRKKDFLFLAIFLAGVALVGAYYFSTLPGETEVVEKTETPSQADTGADAGAQATTGAPAQTQTETQAETETPTETAPPVQAEPEIQIQTDGGADVSTGDGTTAEGSAPSAALVGNPRLEITVAGQANGKIVLELFQDVAPGHVERITQLAQAGAYDNVVFHRVIDGFMAQTGDVEFGLSDGDTSQAGRGGSDMPDLAAEFSDRVFDRGTVGMARSSSPDSANSQFFIMFEPAPHLNGQYTVVGQVVEGLDVLDAIKRGEGGNGAMIGAADVMTSVKVLQ